MIAADARDKSARFALISSGRRVSSEREYVSNVSNVSVLNVAGQRDVLTISRLLLLIVYGLCERERS